MPRLPPATSPAPTSRPARPAPPPPAKPSPRPRAPGSPRAHRRARRRLGYVELKAASDGRIGKRTVEVGQRVQPGQQLAAIVEPETWVVANFKETQLARMKPGQKVHVKVDAFPGHQLLAHVDSFAPASGASFALLPPDNATGNFTKIVQRVPVKVVFEPESLKALGEAAMRLVPGLSVQVEVELGD
jgi:membrane fusion protein (multidrug efflux system)